MCWAEVSEAKWVRGCLGIKANNGGWGGSWQAKATQIPVPAAPALKGDAEVYSAGAVKSGCG